MVVMVPPTMTTPLLSLFAIIRLVYLLLKRKYIYQHKTLIFHFPERNTKFSDSWLARVASWVRTFTSLDKILQFIDYIQNSQINYNKDHVN